MRGNFTLRGKTTKTTTIPSEKVCEMIKNKAYEIYQKRGKKPGDALNDWTLAEKQIKKELGL